MTRNVGNVDRIARVVIGLALLSMLFLVEGDMRWFGLLGLVAIGTAGIGWCPAYRLLGIRT